MHTISEYPSCTLLLALKLLLAPDPLILMLLFVYTEEYGVWQPDVNRLQLVTGQFEVSEFVRKSLTVPML